MHTLPRMTRSNLLTSLARRIEKCIMDTKTVCISAIYSSMSCKNRINIESYEIDVDHLSLIDGNFEVHINFNDSTNIIYEEIEECFTILNGNIEFNLYFM